MQAFCKLRKVYQTFMWMGAFGASSPKPTVLWRPCPCVAKFSLPLPQNVVWDADMVTKKVMPDGRIQVTGSSDLKRSQSYPKEFGRATVAVWEECPKRAMPKVGKASIPNVFPGKSLTRKEKWVDADLGDVFQFLSLGTLKQWSTRNLVKSMVPFYHTNFVNVVVVRLKAA